MFDFKHFVFLRLMINFSMGGRFCASPSFPNNRSPAQQAGNACGQSALDKTTFLPGYCTHACQRLFGYDTPDGLSFCESFALFCWVSRQASPPEHRAPAYIPYGFPTFRDCPPYPEWCFSFRLQRLWIWRPPASRSFEAKVCEPSTRCRSGRESLSFDLWHDIHTQGFQVSADHSQGLP